MKFFGLLVGFLFPLFVFAADVNTKAATALATRVAPSVAPYVVFEKLPGVSAKDKIAYEIENSADGKIVIRGNTTIALTSGFYQYLKRFCHAQVTWGANNPVELKKGKKPPAVPKKIRVASPFLIRYAYNYCTHGYTMTWWSLADWEKEIDWLALHGFNLALIIQGQDAVWQNTFTQFGYTKEEMRNWLCAPTHMPWQFMGNMEAVLPPPQSVIDNRAKLGKAIVSRMRELGIEPVLQGYYGMVPYKFSEKNPNAKIVPQGPWAGGNRRPDMLNPGDELFPKIAETFYTEQKKIFGDCRYFAADPFHEGGRTGDMKRGVVYKQVQDAMIAFEPEAILVKQCWQASNKEMFDAGDKEHSLALDLYCDHKPFWMNCNGYDGTPWIWCLLQNFGGNTGMEGSLIGLRDGLKKAMTAENRGHLVGVGIVPEGSFNNPVIFELLSDVAVQGHVPEKFDKWLVTYLRSRYGKCTKSIFEAWKILLDTAYSYTAKEAPINSALPARPRFGDFIKARVWASNAAIPYENAELLKALLVFSEKRNAFGNKATFRYDYADVQRQIVDNLSHAVYAKLNAAWKAKDKAAFDDAAKDFMRLFALCDSRFDQFPGHKNDDVAFAQSFEKWVNDAQKHGQKKEDKAYLKTCAETLLTRWVVNPGTNLDDYANREWTGLTSGYYAKRWQLFFDAVGKALDEGTDFNQNAFNKTLNDFEAQWTWTGKEKHVPVKDALAEISALVEKYSTTAVNAGKRPDDAPIGIQEGQ